MIRYVRTSFIPRGTLTVKTVSNSGETQSTCDARVLMSNY